MIGYEPQTSDVWSNRTSHTDVSPICQYFNNQKSFFQNFLLEISKHLYFVNSCETTSTACSLSLSLSLPHSLPSSLFSFFLSPFLSFSVLLNLSLSLFYSFFISFSLSLFLYLILHICTYPLKLFVVLWPSVFSIPSILVLQFNPTNWATIVMAELKNISSSFLCLWSLVLCLYTFYDFLADYCSFLFPSG